MLGLPILPREEASREIEAKLLNVLRLEGGLRRSELASFSPNTSQLLTSALIEDEQEAAMRECFSVAFDREVSWVFA